jgi:hypothetical protein
MQNPNIKFAMSTESFTMLAQRALLISLLPDQPQQDPIGVMRPLLPLLFVFASPAVIKRPSTTPSRMAIRRTKNECLSGT